MKGQIGVAPREGSSESPLFPPEVLDIAEVADLIYKDDLTGMYNRRHMREFLARQVCWEEPHPSPLSILMADVDHFKQVNDTYGHLVGDQVLVHVAQALRACFRASDLVVRYAGDEFVIVLPDTDKATAFRLAQRTLAQLEELKYDCGDNLQEIPIGMSIGVATFPEDAQSAKELIERADCALYDSKRSGRGKVTMASANGASQFAKTEVVKTLSRFGFVGREEYLSKLMRYVRGPLALSSPLVLVEGLPGIGKTRLLDEFISQTQQEGLTWLAVRCKEEHRDTPYHALAELVKQLNAQSPGLLAAALRGMDPEEIRYLLEELPELAPNVLTGSPGGPISAGPRHKRLFGAFTNVISSLSMHTALALFLDDFQHVDMATLCVLFALHRRTDACVTAFGALTALSLDDPCLRECPLDAFRRRLLPVDGQFVVEIPLSPLGKEDVSRMVSAIFRGRDVSPQFDAGLHRMSQGNPLCLETILKSMVARGLAQYRDGRWHLKLPPEHRQPQSLDGAIRRHLGRVDTETVRVLAQAAVVGTVFEVGVLKAVTGENKGCLLDHLDKARRAAIVAPLPGREDEQVSFVHPRVRAVAYMGLDPEARRLTHRHIAQLMERRRKGRVAASAAVLTFHYDEAGDLAAAERFRAQALAYANARFDFSEVLPLLSGKPSKTAVKDNPLSLDAQIHLCRALRLCMEGLLQRARRGADEDSFSQRLLGIYVELQHVFLETDVIRLRRSDGRFFINGAWADPTFFGKPATLFLAALLGSDGQGFTIARTIREGEIAALLDHLAKKIEAFNALPKEDWHAPAAPPHIDVDLMAKLVEANLGGRPVA